MTHSSVFVSHSHHDARAVQDVSARIRASGADVFCSSVPDDQRGGAAIPDEVGNSLEACTHFLLVASRAALRSAWVKLEVNAVLMRAPAPLILCLLLGAKAEDLPILLRPMRSLDLDDRERAWAGLDEWLRAGNEEGREFLAELPAPTLGDHFSTPAARLLELLLQGSEHGVPCDPMLDSEEATKALGLSSDDYLDAVSELEDASLIHRRVDANSPSGIAGIYPQGRCFALYDGFVKEWRPEADAIKVAGKMLADASEAVFPRKLATELGWPLRRVNPAISYLVEEGVARLNGHTVGDGEVIAFYASATPRARHWLRERGGAAGAVLEAAVGELACSAVESARPGEPRRHDARLDRVEPPREPADCFVSYTHESKEHKAWVVMLAERLQAAGIRVALDVWDMRPGDDLVQYLAREIQTARHVLMVLTPLYAERAASGEGGAGYESMIVSGQVFTSSGSQNRFIPLVRSGTNQDSIPAFLKTRVFVDFRVPDQFEDSLRELLDGLRGSAPHARPALGPRAGSRQPATRSVDGPARHEEARLKSDPGEIAEVSQRIRSMPAELRAGAHPVDVMDAESLAGRLLVDAVNLGALAGSRYRELRHIIDQSLRGELAYQLHQRGKEGVPPPSWHAFVNAGVWLSRREGWANGDATSLEFFRRACEGVANALVPGSG